MYIDAVFEREKDEILVVERVNGERNFVSFNPRYTFYFEDDKGKFRSIFGDRVSKYQTNSYKTFQKELKLCSGKKTFEADVNPIFRCLADNYLGREAPKLNIAFFDIEVDFNTEKGYSTVEDPFSAVTAISVYMSWLERTITLAIAPNTLSFEDATNISLELEDTVIFKTEREMLEAFLELIDDADVLSGWNSSKYDIPYMIRRIELVLSKDHTRKFCLWEKLPVKRIFTKFGKEIITYDLVGRIHLDYLELYQKHSPQQLHSYRLDYVGEVEVGERKVPYDGTLDDLYKKEFKKFLEYNRQDVLLLVKIDKKMKFIELANQLAHTNTVPLPATMGSVAWIDQAILNEAHALGYVMPNKKEALFGDSSDDDDDDDDDEEDGDAVAGAYVADPVVGMSEWIGAVDINSLYPSAIRTFNMAAETLVGQLRPDLTSAFLKSKIDTGEKSSEAWGSLFSTLEYQEVINKTENSLVLELSDGRILSMTGKEVYDFVFNSGNPYCITSNGTIFRQDQEGIVPHLLTRWFRERKEMQSKAKELYKAAEAEKDPEIKKSLEAEYEYWDRRQYLRKIQLNSLYGAILNPFSRSFDERIGQSTTLNGRMIVKHMISKINEIITGEYDHKGQAIIYGDTDSVSATSKIRIKTDNGLEEITIQELFDRCGDHLMDEKSGKEYGIPKGFQTLSYNPENKQISYKDFRYVYRHKVSKPKWRITDSNGNSVEVTNDHSIMVERDGQLMEIKPEHLIIGDILISVKTV